MTKSIKITQREKSFKLQESLLKSFLMLSVYLVNKCMPDSYAHKLRKKTNKWTNKWKKNK